MTFIIHSGVESAGIMRIYNIVPIKNTSVIKIFTMKIISFFFAELAQTMWSEHAKNEEAEQGRKENTNKLHIPKKARK